MRLELNGTMRALREYMVRDVDRQLYEFQNIDDRKRSADNKRKPISLARAFNDMSTPHGMNGTPEREFFEAVAKLSGESFDRQRILIPLGLLHRDLTVANAGSAGHLVGADTREAIDILRPFSVLARMGMQIETGLTSNVVIPKVSVKSTPAWLSTEASQVTPSQTTLVQMSLSPKTVGVVINFSRQLSLQANAEAFVRRELLRTVATAVDIAVLNGTGASGQPLGLLNTVGLQTQSGTTLNAGVSVMETKKR